MSGPRVGEYLWRSPPSTSCPGKISQLVGWIAGSVVNRAPLWPAPLVRGSFQPMSPASRGSEPIISPAANSYKIQRHCQEPYYQAVPAAHGSCHHQITDQPSTRFSSQLQ
uniref:Uncharacterized protein n=1 Tax=Sciurus vulgaris TaxID=55149 RepID=A0A8D2AHG6_SCIVU